MAQRRGFRQYLAGLLAPRERNKTLTCLAGAEPVTESKLPVVQRLKFFLSESVWDPEAVNAWRLELLLAGPATTPHGGVLVIDESGDRKDGVKTTHAGRQWLGRYGKTDNGGHRAIAGVRRGDDQAVQRIRQIIRRLSKDPTFPLAMILSRILSGELDLIGPAHTDDWSVAAVAATLRATSPPARSQPATPLGDFRDLARLRTRRKRSVTAAPTANALIALSALDPAPPICLRTGNFVP